MFNASMLLVPRVLVIFLLLFTSYNSAWAAPLSSPDKRNSRRSVTLIDKQHAIFIQKKGNRFVYFHEGYSIVGSQDQHSFAEPLPVLYAEDIDANGTPDFWFIPDTAGISEAIDRPSQKMDGWDVARKIMISRNLVRTDWNWKELAARFSSSPYLIINGFSTSHFRKTFLKLTDDLMELHRLELLLERYKKDQSRVSIQLRDYQSIQVTQNIITKRWSELNREIESAMWTQGILTLADMGSFFAVQGVAWGVFKSFGIAIEKLSGSALVQGAQKMIGSIQSRVSQSALHSASKLGLEKELLAAQKVLSKPIRLAIPAGVFEKPLKEQVLLASKIYLERHKLIQMIANSMKAVANTAFNGAREWRYILQTQAIQIAAEIYDNREEVFKDGYSPFVVAKNFVEADGVVQNVLYMTNETFWMSGISTPAAGLPLRQRMLLCSGVAFGNSAAVNVLINGEVDLGRAALDTGWETVIGNAQVQIDMASLKASRAVPGLKWMGYVVAAVDQAAGYYFYSVMTKKYRASIESKEGGQNKLQKVPKQESDYDRLQDAPMEGNKPIFVLLPLYQST